MRITHVVVLCVAFLFVPCAALAAPEPPVHTVRTLTGDPVASRLHETLLAHTAQKRYAGAALLARDGEVFLHAAYGFADRHARRAATVETPFNIGSVGKLFTQVLVLEHVAAGRWALDDTVAALWPESGIPNAEEITIEQLLSHGSGLGNYFGHPDYGLAQRTLDDVLGLVRSQDLAFEPPGSGTSYSNSGFWVLAALLERADPQQRGWRALIEEEVLAIAGSHGHRWYQPDGPAPGRPKGYRIDPIGEEHDETGDDPRPGPDGGLYATVADLHGFAQALRAGGWYGPSLFREAQRVRRPFFVEHCDFALTFEMCSIGGLRFITKGGTTLGGGAELVLFEHDGADWTLVLLSNLSNAPLLELPGILRWTLDLPGARLPGPRLGPAVHAALEAGEGAGLAETPADWFAARDLEPDAIALYSLGAWYARHDRPERATRVLRANMALFDGHPPSARLRDRLAAQTPEG